MNEQIEWFLEMESTPGENAVKTVEITKDLEHYSSLVDKTVAVFRGLTPIFKVLLWVKYNQTILHNTEKSFMKGRVN